MVKFRKILQKGRKDGQCVTCNELMRIPVFVSVFKSIIQWWQTFCFNYKCYFWAKMWYILALKPQDSFGKKDKTFSWSAESAAHRQKTLKNLPALVLNDVFSCNNVKWLNIAMYITYGRVFGLFLENESNLEWTMNTAFKVLTDL